ncbi:MAG: hypothetical protein PVH88_05180 [Ignavibacteria bacterium]|jgi:hypothetical protein
MNNFGQYSGQLVKTISEVDKGELNYYDVILYKGVERNTDWENYRLISDVPLSGESFNYKDKYDYDVYVKKKDKIIVLLALNKEILKVFRDILGNPVKNLITNIVQIDVDSFVRYFDPRLNKKNDNLDLFNELDPDVSSKIKKKYLLTYISATYPPHDELLTTINLWGKNISKSDIYINYLEKLSFSRCGIKRMDYNEKEFVRFSNEGSLQLIIQNNKNLSEFENFISYLISINII